MSVISIFEVYFFDLFKLQTQTGGKLQVTAHMYWADIEFLVTLHLKV